MATLAWVCDLLGRRASARTWWDRVNDIPSEMIPPASHFFIQVVQALTLMLAGAWKKAEKKLGAVFLMAQSQDMPPDETGWLWLLLGMTRTRLGSSDAPEALATALRELAPYEGNGAAGIAKIFGALQYPTQFPMVDPGDILIRLVADQYFDPFWFTYAQELLDLEPLGAQAFLEAHARRTPLALQKLLERRYRPLRRLFARVGDRVAGAAPLTCLRDGRPEPMASDEYPTWQQQRIGSGFRFDGPAGRLSFGSRTAFLRPGSHPHDILSQLLLAFPEPLELKTLYRSVWGGEYDPECDEAAFKIALLRLRRVLKRLSPDLQLVWGKSQILSRHLVLRLNASWEAILA